MNDEHLDQSCSAFATKLLTCHSVQRVNNVGTYFQGHYAAMAPQLPIQALGRLLHKREIETTDAQSVADYLYIQWRNPGDILSLLLILGPEVIRNAVAQLTGRAITPVAFSFGWVAYAVSALLSTFSGRSTILRRDSVADAI